MGASHHNEGAGHPLKLGHLPRPGSLGSQHATNNGGASHPFKLSNLPRPNSIGSAQKRAGNETGSGVRPVCIRAPCPSSLGASRQTGGGNSRPFNVANLPRPNSLGGAHVPGTNHGASGLGQTGNGTKRPFNLANLPKANSLGGAGHQGNAHGENAAGSNGHPNALAAHNPNGGGVVDAAKKVGADQQKLKEQNAQLKTAEKNVANDTTNAAAAGAALKAAQSNLTSAEQKLQADQKNHTPGALIAQDVAKVKSSQSVLSNALSAQIQSQQKLASDKKIAANDKKEVGADKADLKQDKQTLGDKQKIAQQKQEINNLKNQQQSQQSDAGDSGNSNNQSANNDQGQGGASGGDVASQPATSNTTTVVDANGSTTSVAPRVPTTVATTTVVGGAVATSRAALASAPQAVQQPQQPVAPPPAPDPVQAADAGQTFVLVGFQKDISNKDLTAFLQAYNASIVEGPNSDGAYKLQLADQVPPDQMPQVLESMKSQTNVVLSATAD